MRFAHEFSSGTILQQATGEICRGIEVDNDSNQYLWEPTTATFIGPYSSGTRFPAQPYSTFQLAYEAPAGVTQAAPVPGETIFITELSDPVNDVQPGNSTVTAAPSQAASGGVATGKTLNTNQVAVGVAPATLVIAMNTGRYAIALTNPDRARIVYVGQASAVTTLTGTPLLPMQTRAWMYTGALYAVVASGSVNVGYEELAP